MKLTRDEVEEVSAKVLQACPALEKAGVRKLHELIGIVITETTRTNTGVEKCIADAGSIPPDITMTLMHYGALTALLKDLPPGNERRALLEAGEVVGTLIARKFGEKLKEQLVDKATTH